MTPDLAALNAHLVVGKVKARQLGSAYAVGWAEETLKAIQRQTYRLSPDVPEIRRLCDEALDILQASKEART